MSLATRLQTVVASRANAGCETCKWLDSLTDSDRHAFDSWLKDGKSLAQLWEIATSEDINPLQVSITAMRNHIRHHRMADES